MVYFKKIWIGFSAFIVTLGSSHLMSSKMTLTQYFLGAVFIGFGTYFIYSLPPQISFQKNKKHFFIFIFQLIILAILSLIVIKTFWTFLLLSLTFFISFFYVSSFSFLKIPIRKIPYLKSTIVSLSWVSVCIIFPKMNENMNIDYHLTISHFCFFLSLTIPFDIRDLEIDKYEIKSFIQKFSIKTSKILALTLLFFFFLLMTFRDDLNIAKFYFISTIIFLGFLIVVSNHKKLTFINEWMLDGSMVLLAISYLLV